MNMGDAMMLFGRSQCREGSADQRQKSAEKKYSSDRHVALLRARTIPSQPQCSLTNDRDRGLLSYALLRHARPPLPATVVANGGVSYTLPAQTQQQNRGLS
jgi:hypothetical protein